MNDVVRRLEEEGYYLPEPPKPVAAYVPGVLAGDLLFVSGQLPFTGDTLLATGKCPTDVTLDQAQEAAVQCLLNGLAVLNAEIGGDWDRLVRVVRLGVFVQSADDFFQQPLVANGASEVCVEVFGERGRHARAAVGVNALPLNAAVEVECVFQIRGAAPAALSAEAATVVQEPPSATTAAASVPVAPPAAL